MTAAHNASQPGGGAGFGEEDIEKALSMTRQWVKTALDGDTADVDAMKIEDRGTAIRVVFAHSTPRAAARWITGIFTRAWAAACIPRNPVTGRLPTLRERPVKRRGYRRVAFYHKDEPLKL